MSESLEVILLSQEVSSCLSLDKFTVEMDWILNCLVLDWEDLDPLDDLIEEELARDVVDSLARSAVLPRETEVDPVFHHEEAFLPLGPLNSFEKLLIDLRHRPRLDLFGAALRVDKGVAQLCAH